MAPSRPPRASCADLASVPRRDILALGAAAALARAALLGGGAAACSSTRNPQSAISQNPQSTVASRARRLLELAVAGGDAVYDDARGLCVDAEISLEASIASKYSGSWVAWYSPNYAYALLATGARPDRAARIIERILDAQDTVPDSRSFGNFRAISEWSEVRDPNAAVFIVNELAPVWLDHRDALPAAPRTRLRAGLERAAAAVVRRKPDWFYSNIFLLSVASKCLLGRALDRADLLSSAEADWREWVARTPEHNLTEYNSPNYYFHQIAPLLTLRAHAPTEAMRAGAEAAAGYLLLLLAAHYHAPSAMLGGPACRSYLESAILGRGGFHLLMHQFFDAPLAMALDAPREKAEMLEGTMIARHPIAPPPAAAALAARPEYPSTVTARYASWFGKDQGPWDPPSIITATTHHAAAFSLGTHHGIWGHYTHEVPLILTRRGTGPGRNVFLRGVGKFTLVDSYFAQAGGRAAGALFWDRPAPGAMTVWWKSGPYRVAQRLRFGRRDDIVELAKPTAPLGADGRVRVRWQDGLALTVRSIPVPPPATQATASFGEDGHGPYVEIVYAAAETPEEFMKIGPVLFAMEMDVREGVGDATREGQGDGWARERGGDAGTAIEGNLWRLSLADSPSVVAPLTSEARLELARRNAPPIRGALLEAPGIRIDATELARRLGGKARE